MVHEESWKISFCVSDISIERCPVAVECSQCSVAVVAAAQCLFVLNCCCCFLSLPLSLGGRGGGGGGGLFSCCITDFLSPSSGSLFPKYAARACNYWVQARRCALSNALLFCKEMQL